jgi:hypothetical protein
MNLPCDPAITPVTGRHVLVRQAQLFPKLGLFFLPDIQRIEVDHGHPKSTPAHDGRMIDDLYFGQVNVAW